MELIDRLGGLGKILVTPDEDKKIKELWRIVADNGIRCFLSENCQHAPIYNALMQELFPAYRNPKEEISSRVYLRVNLRVHEDFYQGIGNYAAIEIKLPISGIKDQAACLEIIAPDSRKDSEYYTTVILGTPYHPDCVDDIVHILGDREQPPIREAQKIKTTKDSHYVWYGIADVSRLGLVIQLYERATSLVEHASQILGASKKELNILRRDAQVHENLAVRKASATEYRAMLDQLVSQ